MSISKEKLEEMHRQLTESEREFAKFLPIITRGCLDLPDALYSYLSAKSGKIALLEQLIKTTGESSGEKT